MASFWGDSLTANMAREADPLSDYVIFNGGVGGDTSTEIKARFLASARRNKTMIWAGSNNPSVAATVLDDVAEMVAELGHADYLVLAVVNGDYESRYKGTAEYNTIISINEALSETYGERYFDVRNFLISHHDGSAQDLIDLERDIIPSSLRADTIHLTDEGNRLVALAVIDRLGL